MRHTGGTALAEISTKSRPRSRAILRASNGCMTPSWAPSSPITRISRARIRSLVRIKRLSITFLREIALCGKQRRSERSIARGESGHRVIGSSGELERSRYLRKFGVAEGNTIHHERHRGAHNQE